MQWLPQGIDALYSGELWSVMVWYGFFFVALFQFTYRVMFKKNSAGVLSTALASVFLLNMVSAAIIVQQYPSNGQYAGGILIMISIISSVLEKRRRQQVSLSKETKAQETKVPVAMAALATAASPSEGEKKPASSPSEENHVELGQVALESSPVESDATRSVGQAKEEEDLPAPVDFSEGQLRTSSYIWGEKTRQEKEMEGKRATMQHNRFRSSIDKDQTTVYKC